MTEQEAVEVLVTLKGTGAISGEEIEAIGVIDDAMLELEKYRAIGTPEECQLAVEKQIAKKPEPIDYKKYMDSVKNANFLRGAYWCPGCKHVIRSGDYCDDCGQKLDWSDEERVI